MARIAGVEIPSEKRIEISLTYVNGIGLTVSRKILNSCNIDLNTRVKDLNENDLAQIRNKIDELHLQVEGDLKRAVSANVRRLIDIKSYRGKTVGGLKKKIAK
jgi:small subunit ribosomal protein S13